MIQYVHYNPNSWGYKQFDKKKFYGTFSIETPSHVLLNDMEAHLKKNIDPFLFEIQAGYSKLCPTDMFCRKTGRDISVERMKPQEFLLKRIVMKYKKTMYFIMHTETNTGFCIEKDSKTDRVVVVKASFIENL